MISETDRDSITKEMLSCKNLHVKDDSFSLMNVIYNSPMKEDLLRFINNIRQRMKPGLPKLI